MEQIVKTFDDMTPEEIEKYQHDATHTVVFGRYFQNGFWRDANGRVLQDMSEPVRDDLPPPTPVDYSKMSKDELLKLVEVQAIDGADKMTQADIVAALKATTKQ